MNKKQKVVMSRGLSVAAMALTAAVLAPAPGHAEDFYAGKSLEILIGASVGGGYDLPGRAIGRHINRHIPGLPTIVVKNVSGASGLVMTNSLYNAAPRDGTVIGLTTNTVPFEPLVRLASPDGKNIQFDPQKLQWIGTSTREAYIAFVWHTVAARSINDLKSDKILMGSTSPAATNSILPNLTNALLGTQMQVITGYGSQNNLFLALERGEVQGNVTGLTNLTVNKAEWLRDKKVHILVQYALSKDANLPDVPLILDLIENSDDKAAMRLMLSQFEMARPLAAPPGVPADRVRILRAAFDDTMKDSAFLEDAKKLGLEINPMSGEEITALIDEVYKTPKPVIERVRGIILSADKKGG